MTGLRRELGIFSCTLLVAGNMIGIGIFITPGRISAILPHPGWILAAWVFGGILALAGALTFAELSSRFPRAGGSYIYIREAFGPLPGFLGGFSSGIVTLPGTAAFLAIGVTKYAGITDVLTARSVAVGLILAISLVNYWGVKWGADLQDGFMVLKLLLIFSLIGAGFLSANGSWENFRAAGEAVRPLWIAFPLVMVPIMYTYSGWDGAVYVAGEIRDPSRTIPVSHFLGTLTVTAIYLGLATLYIYALPLTRSTNEVRVVTLAAGSLFGPAWGGVVGWLISLSVLGCLSATILTGPRILYAMARDGLFPSAAAGVHPVFASPGKAIWFQAVWACVLAVTGTFDRLLDYVTVPMVFFGAVTGIGLFVLRRRDAKDEGSRPYLAFGYPWVPAVFILGMVWIVANTALKSPRDSLWGMAMVLLGVPIYFLWKWVHRKDLESGLP
ncbi:MAG: hypothetical protein A2902_01310 [Elusimicrobia bacterium RIFCSPLOWO2_01_FULL_64_13]|nr:MAG: hypothetical protein A2902_01310 [Elusimicrobia bacterium RIFCSPLOWO2_01_FULL_64_13]